MEPKPYLAAVLVTFAIFIPIMQAVEEDIWTCLCAGVCSGVLYLVFKRVFA